MPSDLVRSVQIGVEKLQGKQWATNPVGRLRCGRIETSRMRVSSGITKSEKHDGGDSRVDEEDGPDAANHGVEGGVGTVMPRRPAMSARSA